MILTELFHDPTRATWTLMDDPDSSAKLLHYEINTTNQQHYVLTIGFLTMGIWSVSFSLTVEGTRGGSTSVTGTGNAGEVFNAVADCLRHFVRVMQPKGMMFTGKGGSRQRLYSAMAQKIATELGWTVDTEDLEGTLMYTIHQRRTK